MEIITEAGYRDRMDREVVPYLEKYRNSGFFSPEDGQEKLYFESYRREDAKGVIVILHGFTESAEKYLEMIYYFLQAGYQVYSMDLRGHGRSRREEGDLSLVHIGHYQHYLADLEYMIENVMRDEDRALPMHLYGHSMGGGIGAAFMEWRPEVFRSAVLSSPMIKPLTGGITIGIARGIAEIQVILGRGRCYVPGHHAFRGDETFEDSASTSAERYAYYARKRQQEKLFQTNGASYSWLREAARMSKYILKRKNCRKIVGRVLVFQAEQETYVDKAAQELFVSRVRGARLVPVAGTKHEIYRSDDGHMRGYVEEVLGFFA